MFAYSPLETALEKQAKNDVRPRRKTKKAPENRVKKKF